MKTTSTAFKISCAVLAVLAIAGVGAWIHQLANGDYTAEHKGEY